MKFCQNGEILQIWLQLVFGPWAVWPDLAIFERPGGKFLTRDKILFANYLGSLKALLLQKISYLLYTVWSHCARALTSEWKFGDSFRVKFKRKRLILQEREWWGAFVVRLNFHSSCLDWRRQNVQFKKWAFPGLFFIYFRLFNQALQLLQQMWKISIQYSVLGFCPTAFGMWVSSQNHPKIVHAMLKVCFLHLIN